MKAYNYDNSEPQAELQNKSTYGYMFALLWWSTSMLASVCAWMLCYVFGLYAQLHRCDMKKKNKKRTCI